ncbi:Fatty acid synthase [Pseudolycoriella hygida]|uniref:Fatty acid synthase n=1 Tax=Pseudolycoriella hygida TaxID=35572 RepID=A0A9Q0RU78_9DIPT|nr:Fatty acid synthase [Pseudolycoriella hygida]
MGKINDLEKFDATFFGIPFKQAHTMDPQSRLLIETAYEAILGHAGINPRKLRETKTGVFIGSCSSESEKTWYYEKMHAEGLGITGCSRAMFANRVSYSLGFTGPSFLVDTACSSSCYALVQAFTAIRNGECEAAIVGGANLCLLPHFTLQFARLGVLAADGYCRPFDANASGYSRSETICAILLQKAKHAKRIYSTVVYTKTNCDGYKPEGITYPSGKMQEKLLSEFYQDIQMDPSSVSYVEAHGTGTIVGDPQECQAIDSIFCKGRTTPLLIGSVKSNIGHSEAGSGCCSVAKVIFALEKGLVAPNINFTKVRPEIKAMVEGRLKLCTEPTKLEGSLIGINSFGFGGANAHCLMRQHSKEKLNNGAPQDKIPRLVIWSGRTEEATEVFFKNMEQKSLDAEYVGLIHSIQNQDTPGYMYRCFGLYEHCPDANAFCLNKEMQHFSGLKRPIVWVFSGMGSQWVEMGTSLLELPLFRASIQRSHEALKPYNLDLIQIITSQDPKIFENILNSFVGIAAIQVALVDVLRALNLSADYFIGHSVGELGCAYADGCMTGDQMVLAAYSRGMASLETDKIRGSMAAVGLGYKQIKNIIPPTIEVACRNASNSSTISGPEEEVAAFVKLLKNQGTFAREVNTSNIAYHSRYIADIGPNLLKRLKEVIPEPKRKSDKWLSSSIPKIRWDQEENQYSSPEYHTNNLLSSVLFEETMALLPENAITIEFAPHGLLQAIMKKGMPNGVHIPLTQRGNKSNLNFFLNALGKLYLNGLNLTFENLYPAINYPVSRGTPKISPMIRWEHSEDWFVTNFEQQDSNRSAERRIKVNLKSQDFNFIAGHAVDGRCLFPATAYLHMVWETLAMTRGLNFLNFAAVNVQFEDIRFLRATSVIDGQEIEFRVMIQIGTGRFEITEGNTAVVTGFVMEVQEPLPVTQLRPLPPSEYPLMSERDFYKELRLRGYHYSGAFRSVTHARGDGLYGKIKWDLNWVSYLDCLLQIHLIGKDSRSLILPTRIQKMRINAKDHITMVAKLDPENPCFEVQVCPALGILVSGGIEIFGVHTSPVARRKPPGFPVLETYKFVPHCPSPKLTMLNAVRVCVQLALENIPQLKVKAVEVDEHRNKPIINLFELALGDLPLITSDLMFLTPQDIQLGNIHVEDGHLSAVKNCTFVVAFRCLSNLDFVEKSLSSLTENGYLVSRESLNLDGNAVVVPHGLQLVANIQNEEENLVVFQKIKRKIQEIPVVVYVDGRDSEWLEKLQTAMKESPVIVVSERDSCSGILGLVNCIRKEPNGNRVTCVFICDESAPPFSLDDTFYSNQLKLGLAINVFQNGQWGSYRHLELVQVLEEKPRSDHCYGNVLQRGDLSTLTWVQGAIDVARSKDLVNIQYASLNFRDVMLATGRLAVEVLGINRLEQECVLGFEFAGVNKDGQRVMGTALPGCLGTHTVPQKHLTWIVPDEWSLKEAVTCPVVYLTVYTAFFTCNPIKRGNSILIHAGSGGIGLAAIRVALAYGLEVYTTVSNPQKKRFIMETYPQLKECNIGNSRDCSFEAMIKIQTDGKGVDFVLNSLSDDKLHASIRCLARGGTFLEIGKFDLANDTKIGLGDFLKEISFRSVLVDNLFTATDDTLARTSALVENDLRSGIIQPLFATVFDVQDIEKAFRYLGTGKHVGKVVLKIRDDPFSSFTVPMKVVPRVHFDPNLVFIIPGGLGGFGLELADWMVVRGARKLMLSSSRGITKSYQTYRIKIWEGYGTEVVVNTSDITTREGCEKLIRAAQVLGPVGGIFNLAVVLRDNILENQNVQKFAECLAPKADATLHLDQLCRKMCPQLRHFVVFSSVSCGRGNASQSNYGMANSIMERIIEKRVACGLPGKAIQWGAVGEVGLLADMAEDKLDMEISGTLQQRISSCLVELDVLLTSTDPIVGSMVVAEKRAGSGGKGNIIDSVLNIMGIRDIKQISMTASLSEVGMDSLVFVELKQTLEREFEIFLSPQDLRALTFARLQELSDARVKDGAENVKLKLASESKGLGLDLILRNLGDEKNRRQPLIRLSTKNISEKFNSCMLIVPGIEGVAGISWHNLAAGINLPAFVLQLTETIEMKSIPEITNAIAINVKEIFSEKEFFYLVGYSFGSFITLELARILEDSGMTGNVVLIDGAPVFLKQLSYGHISSEVTDESIQLMLIIAIIQIIFPTENPEELSSKIKECPTWEAKLDKLVQFVKSQVEFSEEYIRSITKAVYNRLKIVFEFDTTHVKKIKSPITLIRPTEVAFTEIEEDYELSRFTEMPVTLKFIEGNHSSMLDNIKLADIVNQCDPYIQAHQTFEVDVLSGINSKMDQNFLKLI